jgi:hypothetical protein
MTAFSNAIEITVSGKFRSVQHGARSKEKKIPLFTSLYNEKIYEKILSKAEFSLSTQQNQ